MLQNQVLRYKIEQVKLWKIQVHALVESTLTTLHKSLASAKTPQEKESMQKQVESTDGAIDRLVYELSPEGDNNMG